MEEGLFAVVSAVVDQDGTRVKYEIGVTGCWVSRCCPIPRTGRTSYDDGWEERLWLQIKGPSRL